MKKFRVYYQKQFGRTPKPETVIAFDENEVVRTLGIIEASQVIRDIKRIK
jgi:hypothetical protein